MKAQKIFLQVHKLSFFAVIVAAFGLNCVTARATPSRVILIRHAEKPADDNDPHLSEVGRERAKALPVFFKENQVALEKPNIDFIIAMPAKKKKDDSSSSLRAIETVEPFAQSLGKEIVQSFSKKNISVLAEALLTDKSYDGKVVLVCWNREGLPEIAAALGIGGKSLDWGHATFNRAWVIDFSPGKDISFRDIAQNLLPGDSSEAVVPAAK